jgi:hypothetical protein
MSPSNNQLLDSRGEKSDFTVGERVQVSARCGDFGEDNHGIVVCVADKLDPTGRHFLGVKMLGMPAAVGSPECEFLTFAEAVRGNPPLPQFEAGLLSRVKA